MSENNFERAMKWVYPSLQFSTDLDKFIGATLERHNVHPAPWTAALILNFEAALAAFSAKLAENKHEDCAKLSKWLVDACLSLQESFMKAGTPAPSGPAEFYLELLKKGYRPPEREALGQTQT